MYNKIINCGDLILCTHDNFIERRLHYVSLVLAHYPIKKLVLGQRLTSNIQSCVTCNFKGLLVVAFFVGWITGIAGRHLIELNARYLTLLIVAFPGITVGSQSTAVLSTMWWWWIGARSLTCLLSTPTMDNNINSRNMFACGYLIELSPDCITLTWL